MSLPVCRQSERRSFLSISLLHFRFKAFSARSTTAGKTQELRLAFSDAQRTRKPLCRPTTPSLSSRHLNRPKHARLDARDARCAARNDGRAVPTFEFCSGPPRSVRWLLSLDGRRELIILCPHRAGIYRSGHPNKGNFPFLDSLNLKTIM